jgi:hypothetical protein
MEQKHLQGCLQRCLWMLVLVLVLVLVPQKCQPCSF